MKNIVLMGLTAAFVSAVAAERKYIAAGWEFRNLKPAEILAHADRFASLPIDGITIVVSAKNPKGGMFTQIGLTDFPAWTWEAFADQVPILKEIVSKPNLTESFLAGYRAPMHRAAWTNDAAWACIANNMAVLARLAHEAGVKGITIDHEDYRAQRQYFRLEDDPPYDECCRLARARGRQVFGAVFREHPTAILLSFWILTENRSYFTTRHPEALMRETQDLWPSFVAGILDALPPSGRLIEGDEHGYRHEHSLNEFHVAYANARRWGSMLLPEDVRAKHAARVEQSFGQYLDYYTHPYTPGKRERWSVGPEGGSRLEHFRRNIQVATDLASEYIWLWGERYPWIAWDDSATKNPGVDYGSTWEQQLPGLSEMLEAVKGGEDGEMKRLKRLLEKGSVSNLLANVRMLTWQVTKDKRGRPYPQGTFRPLANGVFECENLTQGTFYCYQRGIKPGERYAFHLYQHGRGASAGITGCDAEGALPRLPSPQMEFGAPDADGWREGRLVVTVPSGVNHCRFTFGANRQKPGEKVQFRNVAAYRLWP